MISFPTTAALVKRIGVTEEHLVETLAKFDSFIDELKIICPAKPSKVRKVVSARDPLRSLQSKFYRWVLLPHLPRSSVSHGGMPGRSIRTNALAHQGNAFVYTTDVSDFFPTIRHERVLAMFRRFGWGERPAAQATRLCTYDARLAQGLVSSLILADQVMHAVDNQILKACGKQGLTYTRYVDDITISGPFNFERSGIPSLVRDILKYNGFRAKVEKEQFGALAKGTPVTKVRVLKNRLDVTGAYLIELERQLRDHRELGKQGRFDGPFYTQDQLWGRVEFVSWICPKRRGYLYGLLSKINWAEVCHQAFTRNLIARIRGVVRREPEIANGI